MTDRKGRDGNWKGTGRDGQGWWYLQIDRIFHFPNAKRREGGIVEHGRRFLLMCVEPMSYPIPLQLAIMCVPEKCHKK